MLRQLFFVLAASLAYGQQSSVANSAAPSKQNVVEKVLAATVFIKTDTGVGTGFIVIGDGTIVTANHVVADAQKVACKTGNGEIYDKVSLIARDERRDIAILKVAGFELSKVDFAELSRVEPGQHVLVIGNPLDLGNKDSKMTVTDGVVSGFRDFGWGYRILQISAPITPGNSGGPVVNDEGKVLGIASFKAVAGESLSFATPIDYVRGLLALPADAKPLSSWDSPAAENPFNSANVQSLTDYWKSSQGPMFYVKDTGKEVSIVNLSAPDYTYDFKWADGLIIGFVYGVGYTGNAKDFCALRKIDDSHLHRVCFRYKKEHTETTAVAEAEKRFAKPTDVWIRVR